MKNLKLICRLTLIFTFTWFSLLISPNSNIRAFDIPGERKNPLEDEQTSTFEDEAEEKTEEKIEEEMIPEATPIPVTPTPLPQQTPPPLLKRNTEIPNRIFLGSYNEIWRATLFILKDFTFTYISKDRGLVKTRWYDNTLEQKLVDGPDSPLVASKMQLFIQVKEGSWQGRPACKVTIFKRQNILLNSSTPDYWPPLPSDGLYEKKLFYRLGRAIGLNQTWIAGRRKALSSQK